MPRLQRLATASTPVARSSHGLSGYKSTAYLLGGEHIPRTPIDSTVYALDVHRGEGPYEWKAMEVAKGSPPPLRVAHAQCVVEMDGEPHLVVFGGRQGVGMNEQPLGDLCAFNLTTREWRALAAANPEAAPSPRSFHRMAALGPVLYVFGGCVAAGGRAADLYAFDTTTLQWEPLPPAPCAGRGGAGFFATPGRLYVVAGFIGRETNDIFVYDISKRQWDTLSADGQLPEFRPRSVFAQAAASTGSEDTLYLLGGEAAPSGKGHEGAGAFLAQLATLTIFRSDNRVVFTEDVLTDAPPDFRSRGWLECAHVAGGLLVFGGLTGDDAHPERLDDTWLIEL